MPLLNRLPPSTPRISVVVASRDRPAELRRCLVSVNRQRTADVELIVVDSASSNPDATVKVAQGGEAVCLVTSVPGAARARNLGISCARGEIVAFTDDDAIVDSAWLAAIRHAFANPRVDAVVGPVFVMGTSPPLAMQPNSGIDPALDRMLFSRSSRRWFDQLAFGSIGFGANLAVRRDAFKRFGVFRECLGAGAPISGDENYFLLTLVANGATVANEPGARVLHPAQSPARVRELRRSAVAYLLYVMGTQPRIAHLAAARILRRIVRKNTGVQPIATGERGENSLFEYFESLAAAPRLLFEAGVLERLRTAASAAD